MIVMGKLYQTRDGRPVRLVAVDDAWAFGFVGSMRRPCIWNADTGKASSRFDDLADTVLIEVRQKITRTYWLVHYAQGSYCYWQDDAPAKPVDTAAIAITGPHEITFTEGEGLDGAA